MEDGDDLAACIVDPLLAIADLEFVAELFDQLLAFGCGDLDRARRMSRPAGKKL